MKIAVLPGDGIGPEVMQAAVRVLDALALPGVSLFDGDVGAVADRGAAASVGLVNVIIDARLLHLSLALVVPLDDRVHLVDDGTVARQCGFALWVGRHRARPHSSPWLQAVRGWKDEG